MLDSLQLGRAQRNLLKNSAETYQHQLDHRTACYLADRGIGREAAHGARLGSVCDPLPGDERFAGRLSIPYLSPAGVVGIKYRCTSSHDCKAESCQKYDQPDGQKPRLYGVNDLHRTEPYIVITEGELDALVCSAVVGVPAVGTPGTTWLDHYARVFVDYPTVLVSADNDLKADGTNPGLKHARKVARALLGARVVEPPAGLDLSEWCLADGPDVVRKAMLG